MTRQLLPRPATRPARRRAAAAPATQPVLTGARAVTPAPTRVLRRPVVLALVAAAAVVVGGLAWTLLAPSGGDLPSPASALLRPRAASPAATPGGSTTPADAAGGRNPFAVAPAPSVTAPTTSPHVEVTTSPAATTATGAPVPATSPASPSAAPTVTVTVTAPAAPTYVGLYAWNGSRASFRVDARTFSVHVGTRFGPGLTFASVVRGDPPCARVSYAKGGFTLCPGQVTTLP